jgi:hypothetical protein
MRITRRDGACGLSAIAATGDRRCTIARIVQQRGEIEEL